ncbi:MAG TPA: CarD family transcriptional regulator [Candidatus Megaira endosymbiont of Nemacystus decipiens]|nr:CarD family transcriptional regulator [Candidatus Megaera endosymbiont of Nemacystus decipiens]
MSADSKSDVEFSVGDKVVYPSHGVGEIVDVESESVLDAVLKVYVISFPQDKMTLRVPVTRAKVSGLRSLSTESDIKNVYEILNTKPKRGNKMWSRRAQEYAEKINSGNIEAVAEVVRDLYKNVDTDRSYSERTIYESALNRLASEIAVLQQSSTEAAVENLVDLLKDKLAAA